MKLPAQGLMNTCNKTTIFIDKIGLIFSAISTLFMLIWVLWYSQYGIDFTDESYYLVWMADPFNYSISATQFGFIYHPLYQLLDGNIVALRQVNILITFFLTLVLSNMFVRCIYGKQILDNTSRFIVSCAISMTSLSFVSLCLSTPSYNSLALQALLMVAIGLLLVDKKVSSVSIFGWVLIGIGGWLTFMAKPTITVALSICVVLYLSIAGKFSISLIVLSLITAISLFIFSALSIDGSIITFIERLKDGVELAKILGGGHTFAQILRLDGFHFGGRAILTLIITTWIIFFSAYISQSKIKKIAYGSNILSIVFALVCWSIIFGFINNPINLVGLHGLFFLSIPFASVLVGMALYQFKGLLHISRFQWACSLSFLIFPHVYAFGTNGNYWIVGSSAAIFWILAGLVLLSPVAHYDKFMNLLLSICIAIQLVTVMLINTGIEEPYRQPQPLRENNYIIAIGKPGSTLTLSKSFGKYFSEAINLAKQLQFRNNTPMIDLSGQSPGLLYALGARNTGQPWLIGGYPGSDKFVVEALKKESCKELAVAWLLVEPRGPRKLSTEILSSFGADLTMDFEIVGTFKTAEGAGGYKEARWQQLLKPVRATYTAITACLAARTTTE